MPGTIILLLLAVNSVFAQTGDFLNVNTYTKYFDFRYFQNGKIDFFSPFLDVTPEEDDVKFGNIGGINDVVDTPLEFALLSYCSDPVRTIRPPEADALLPANNPRLADQKLGAAVFQEMQVLRFLNDAPALARHDAVLQYIISRGNATRQEIEAFFRTGIQQLVSDVVDGEFNKISFMVV